MAEGSAASFGTLLRQLRAAAGLTQEELAEAAQVSVRTVSDLEREITPTPRRETVRRLAEVLQLTGAVRMEFAVAARRTRAAAPAVRAPGTVAASPGPARSPQEWLHRVVAALDELGTAAARSAMSEWQDHAAVETDWLDWVTTLIRLTAEGRLPPVAQRPLPATETGPFVGRVHQGAEVSGFLDRVQRGRGGLALILGPSGIGKSRLVTEVLANSPSMHAEWVTLDRGEAGYRGWRRLLAPLWITVRRRQLSPAGLVSHAGKLDDILLADRDGDLGGRLFPGEVTAAIAALLEHVADRQPLVLVVDDAHRGGASSDHLLLDLARRVSANAVGIIAALRPDELEPDSPLRDYSDQADGRAALDMVVPIHVPPLDLESTADLLRQRIGVQPPPKIVEQVLRQTGGRPQLIDNTQLQVPASGAAATSWVVGKLDTPGLRVLESTIQSRPDQARTALHAAAVCAVGGYVEPGVVASVTDLPAELVAQVLDEERQHGTILTPHVSGYCFQHDSWIDALTGTCPPAQLRELHARCLALMRADPAADPRRLADHAIGAGAGLVGGRELAALARQAADLAFADYAFGRAAELYEVAARYTAGADRITLLIGRADSLRFGGRWAEARDELRTAAAQARGLGVPGLEALALVHLERLTWSFGLDEKELTQQIRDVINRLPSGEVALRAQAQAALGQRLSIAARQYQDEQTDLARAALRALPQVSDPVARCDIVLGSRNALQGYASPDELLGYDLQVLNLGIESRSAYHIGEALSVRVVDLIRGGRLLELPPALRAHRDFADQNATPVVAYGQALIDAMLLLARGEFSAAQERTAEATRLSEAWGESMAGEALMAQAGWLLYETGKVEGLAEILADLPGQDVNPMNEPVWTLGAGLIHAEQGDSASARRMLREVVASTGTFAGLPSGPSRIAILATAATLLGHPLLSGALPTDEAARWGEAIAGLLARHPDEFVVAGWPAVILGSKHRYIGLAHLAAGQPAEAVGHLTLAADQNSQFAALHVRTRFDLARSLLRQPASRSAGSAEIGQVERRATELGMPVLAAQAVAESVR